MHCYESLCVRERDRDKEGDRDGERDREGDREREDRDGERVLWF